MSCRTELKRDDLRGWLRIVPRKPWALTIPYTFGGKTKSVYIDFLVVRDGKDGLVVDIIDPHNPNLGDAADKLAGLGRLCREARRALRAHRVHYPGQRR